MQRFVYAKVYCDLLRHPRFRNRPDCDIRLVLGLILEAKENTADGVIRELTPENARSLCHIKAPVRFVKAALEHLVLSGWLIPHPENAYEIKDFLQRQERDSASERMKRHRDGGVTKRNAAVTPPSPEVEVDGEKEVEKSNKSLPLAIARRPRNGLLPGATVPTRKAYLEAFEKRWGVLPTPDGNGDATMNGLLARFLKRVGSEEGPDIAAFYVTSTEPKYVLAKHPLELLLRDAPKLRAEWKGAARVTVTEARRQDQTQANVDGWGAFLSQESKHALERK